MLLVFDKCLKDLQIACKHLLKRLLALLRTKSALAQTTVCLSVAHYIFMEFGTFFGDWIL